MGAYLIERFKRSKIVLISVLAGIAVFFYLFYGTGIHSDDYDLIKKVKPLEGYNLLTLWEIFKQEPKFLFSIPMTYYVHWVLYFGNGNELLYTIIKTVTFSVISLLVFLFSKDYMDQKNAIIFSFIFLFYPIHDSTTYWIVGFYMLSSLALIMLSHKLIRDNNFKLGFIIGILGSFYCYASPAFSFGLSTIFLAKRQYKKFIAFILPELAYVAYYFAIVKVHGYEGFRTGSIDSISKIIKQFIIQIITFCDVAIGPSLFFKIYYSFFQLSTLSILTGIFVLFFLMRYYWGGKSVIPQFDLHLLYGCLAVTFFSFGMFSLTGAYPQIAFNLGNRVTTYGSLLLALMVVMILSRNKKIGLILVALLVFSIMGISDHWKDWNKKQQAVIANVFNNTQLKDLDPGEKLFVSGNQYSRYGPFSHIEFFESGVAKFILQEATGKELKVSTLNKGYAVEGDYLVDKKYGNRFIIDKYIYVYDSNQDKLLIVPKDSIQDYINGLPKNIRHWIQLSDNGIAYRAILYFMPRLQYIFDY